jgi:adenylate kinase
MHPANLIPQVCLTLPTLLIKTFSFLMLNLVLFGPPGSGKGTQAETLKAKYNLVHISTGDLLRQEIKDQTALGIEAKKLMDQGLLVPDEIMIGMIDSKLEANKDAAGIIFDGFPRTIPQAEALDNLLAGKNTKISACLFLQVSEEELVKRLLLRGETSARPDDRDENIIRNRVKVYREQTLPVAEYYGAHGKREDIKGEGSIEDIFSLLTAAIEKVK